MPSISERALDYLAQHRVATLATHGPEGPWAAAVFYANAGFDFIFLSSPGSRHACDLGRKGAAAATIQEDYADWRAIQGVQLGGEVIMLDDVAMEQARTLYALKFPIAQLNSDTPAPVAAALSKVRWYRFIAARAYWIDNAAGFGKREQVL
ncbi:MAG: pyridoxamine 5'-phosphate oxidase family protein [Burkholderiales bacterium]|nr:pyridoxamine 5'-phosphate oxidase family protein [Burkholderiales bacterium]